MNTTRRIRTGRAISALPVLFLVFDSTIKLINIAPVTEGMLHLGYPVQLAPVIGALEIICLAVHLMPRTSVIGALLLTGFLGGAVATHVRIGDPLLTHIMFPIYMAALIWAGLCLRNNAVTEALLPSHAKAR